MTPVRLSEETSREFFERFGGFEDAVITEIRIHFPRGSIDSRNATFDIQAMDVTAGDGWHLVQITVGGVYKYQFNCSEQQTHFVLSDGLNLERSGNRFVLDLDPRPDEWSAEQVGKDGQCSKQYAIGAWCEYEVFDGPFT